MKAWVTLRIEPLACNEEPVEFVGFIDTCNQHNPPMLGSFAAETGTVADVVGSILGNRNGSGDSEE